MKIKFESKKYFAVITLTNDAEKNCLSPELMQKIIEFTQKAIKPAHRFVLLLAEGSSYCAGADLNWMKKQKDGKVIDNYNDSQLLQVFFSKLYEIPVPLITYVQGPAFGGGVGLVACADYAFAAPTAKFCLSEVKLGLAPAVISPYVITKIGLSWFQALSTSAKAFLSAEALRIGLVHEIVGENFLQASADEQLEHITKGFLQLSPEALRANKKIVRSYSDQYCANIERQLSLRASITALRASPEGIEGMSSILDKTKPSWIVEE